MKFVPHPYQEAAMEAAWRNKRLAIWKEPGLGKTVAALTVLQRAIQSVEVFRALVLAPKKVALNTWPAEVEKWDHLTLHYNQLAGKSPAQRVQLIEQGDADFDILNIELFPWLAKHYRFGGPWDMLIIDEASCLKATNTARWKALRRWALNHVFRGKAYKSSIVRVLELTGTPTSTGLHQLWPQMYLLDAGKALGRTQDEYLSRYFSQNEYSYKIDLLPGAEEAIHRAVKPLTFTLRAKDYLQLPDLTVRDLPVHLSDEEKARYEEIKAEKLLPAADDIDEPLSAATLAGKLAQLASGFIYETDPVTEVKTVTRFSDAKLQALKRLIDELQGRPLVVAYHFRADAELIQAEIPGAVALDDSPETVNRWNRGEIPVLLLHPQSAGHGLNLQAGGADLCWYTLTWSAELWLQLVARLHRQGQTRPVFVYRLITEGTVDEDMRDAVEQRVEGHEALMNACARHIKP